VLRDGKTVGTKQARETTEAETISAMVGRSVENIFPAITHTHGDTVLEARNLTLDDPDVAGKRLVDNVSFSVRRGEVLGIAGLMGAGRSEILMSLFGAFGSRARGEIYVDGTRVQITSPSDAIRHGLGFVTEDRKRFGLVLDQTILNNMTLAGLPRIAARLGGLLTDRRRETVLGEQAARDLRVKAPSVMTGVGTLSGGNQQKVVLAKWLLTNPKVLLLDEPTRGIDVGAKQEIYREINRLAQTGLAIVLVSSELPEVLGLSDRVLVLHEGRLAGEFTRTEATPEKVMAAATGHQPVEGSFTLDS